MRRMDKKREKSKTGKQESGISNNFSLIAILDKINEYLIQAYRYKREIGRWAKITAEELGRVKELFLENTLINQGEKTKEIIELEKKVEVELNREFEKLKMIEELAGPISSFPEQRKRPPGGRNQGKISLKAAEKAELKVGRTDGINTRKILIIEDDPITTRLMSYFLGKENYSVTVSRNGEDGLKAALKEKPDLIFLGIKVSVQDSFQFLSHFKKIKKISSIPVVIMSSLSQEGDVLRGFRRVARDYIIRPFSPHILIAKVRKNINAGEES